MGVHRRVRETVSYACSRYFIIIIIVVVIIFISSDKTINEAQRRSSAFAVMAWLSI